MGVLGGVITDIIMGGSFPVLPRDLLFPLHLPESIHGLCPPEVGVFILYPGS
jgi:hypothetical protein